MFMKTGIKLGIFIGSFNPPHKGHIKVVRYLLEKKYIDQILIVPTLNYWNKNNLIDINDRINMLKTYENDIIKVDTEFNKYIYTVELMKELSKKYKDELYLILGADNIVNFDKWKDYQELLKYKITVVNRGDVDIDKYISKYNSNNFIVINDFENINISSTKIRDNLDSKYLDKEVLDYIKEHKLYERSN